MSFEGQVLNGVVVLDNGKQLPDGTRVEVIVREPATAESSGSPSKRPRTSLADWADANAESWGEQLRSDDVEGFKVSPIACRSY